MLQERQVMLLARILRSSLVLREPLVCNTRSGYGGVHPTKAHSHASLAKGRASWHLKQCCNVGNTGGSGATGQTGSTGETGKAVVPPFLQMPCYLRALHESLICNACSGNAGFMHVQASHLLSGIYILGLEAMFNTGNTGGTGSTGATGATGETGKAILPCLQLPCNFQVLSELVHCCAWSG